MPGEYSLNDLSGVLGGDLYTSLFGTQGYTNGGANPWQETGGMKESGEFNFLSYPNQDALNSFQNYSYNWAPEGGQAGTLSAFDPSGKSVGNWKQEKEDNFTKLMDVVAPAVASWGFGGALSNLFGGGILGGAAGQGLANGSMSSAQGGSFGNGFLSGAVSGGMDGMAKAGTSPAGMLGMDKGPFANMVNRGVGSTLGGLAGGQSGSDALKSGITGSVTSGINSLGQMGSNFLSQTMNSFLGSGDSGFEDLQGSGGDPALMENGNNRYDEFVTGSDGMTIDNPAYRYAGDQNSNTSFSPVANNQGEEKQAQSAGLPSIFGQALSGVGDFAKNNAGDLASMLYGFYNNRKQQQALGKQMSSLEGLYSANSPYATQLRNTLNAKAAQTGRRSNVAGRETQLQAALADRYAQLQPTMLQLNQASGNLKNNNMNMLLQGVSKMGGFKGLSNLFSRSPYSNYSMSGNTSNYNSLGMDHL